MATKTEVDVEGHKIHALSHNEEKGGIPFIFIHGITASINFWQPVQAPFIRDHFRWFSLSLPGHYPARLPAGFQKESFTADMVGRLFEEAIWQLVDRQPVILVGHSTGGFAALSIAARMEELVKGVISISGFAQGKWTGALGLLQKMARLGVIGQPLFKVSLKALIANKFIYRHAARLYANDRKALYTFPEFDTISDLIFEDARKLDSPSLFPYFNRLPDIDISASLSRISAPTLALAGDSDPIVPPQQSRHIASQVQNGQVVHLKGAGHLPMIERPTEYNAVLRDWLESTI